MSPEIMSLFDRIQADLNALRELTSKVETLVIQPSYSKKAALTAKERIEDAYKNGVITYDKKRGLKMLVTKRTQGLSTGAECRN